MSSSILAEVVYLGIEPINIYSVSLSEDTFQSTFVVWWRWRGSIDPCQSTEVLNSTNSSNMYTIHHSYTNAEGKERPIKWRTGDSYQAATISSGITDPFSPSRYPLDSQVLRIAIANNTYDFQDLAYVADIANMSKHPTFEVADWSTTGESVGQYKHTYDTNFGAPGLGNRSSQYSRITYDIDVERPVSHFLVKLFLPFEVHLFGALVGPSRLHPAQRQGGEPRGTALERDLHETCPQSPLRLCVGTIPSSLVALH